MKTEFPSFYTFLLRSNKFDEDELNLYVDSSYNQDTYMWELVDAISKEYTNDGSRPMRVYKTRVRKVIHDLAAWTVQDRSTPEARKIAAMANKYADAGAKFFVRYWRRGILELLD